MFIKVTTASEIEITINIAQITSMCKNSVVMSNEDEFTLSDQSIKDIEESIFGTGAATVPSASVHTETLLNELNKLCGGKGDAKPTTDRKSRLKSRLKDFSQDELKKAARQLGEDEFMQGENDSGKRYGTIDYLLRTSANVNKWLEDQPEKKPKKMF